MKVEATPAPADSLLAEYGREGAYRDCFSRLVPGAVSHAEFVERFYCSRAFRPERLLLGWVGPNGAWKADDATARAVAQGEADRFAAWSVVERRTDELLLKDHRGATASWFSVRPREGATELLFGSWVGEPERGLVKALMPFHRWYSRVLLGGV